MKIYHAKTRKVAGTDFREVYRTVHKIYQQISKKTKRRAYIRSAYFNKEKIF
ncbi:MAG: hypothetical protein HYV41_05360 [Candidatus Magasanikbacteria bacterium]|nr:hypothetical protein [Candidatus Magasanikbacteria bacterium]